MRGSLFDYFPFIAGGACLFVGSWWEWGPRAALVASGIFLMSILPVVAAVKFIRGAP